MSKIESKLTLFKMQIKSRFVHSAKPGQSSFGESPKPFDAINVGLPLSEFIFPVVNAKMFSIADINEPIIATPSIGIDHAFPRRHDHG